MLRKGREYVEKAEYKLGNVLLVNFAAFTRSATKSQQLEFRIYAPKVDFSGKNNFLQILNYVDEAYFGF